MGNQSPMTPVFLGMAPASNGGCARERILLAVLNFENHKRYVAPILLLTTCFYITGHGPHLRRS